MFRGESENILGTDLYPFVRYLLYISQTIPNNKLSLYVQYAV